MHTEDAIVNNRSQGKVVEDVSAVSPHIHTAILSQTFIIEAINLCDLSTFVITSNEHNPFRIANFESEQ